jgi:hypothetical protein
MLLISRQWATLTHRLWDVLISSRCCQITVCALSLNHHTGALASAVHLGFWTSKQYQYLFCSILQLLTAIVTQLGVPPACMVIGSRCYPQRGVPGILGRWLKTSLVSLQLQDENTGTRIATLKGMSRHTHLVGFASTPSDNTLQLRDVKTARGAHITECEPYVKACSAVLVQRLF